MPTKFKLQDRPIDRMLAQSRFAEGLSLAQRRRIESETVIRRLAPGGRICRKGDPIQSWVGVVDGLAKIENSSFSGRTTTLLCAGAGSWLGEGSVLKGGHWPYDMVALSEATIAFMPRSTFLWLLGESLPFNRFIIEHLNARLGQFIQRCEHMRLHQTDHHVAHCLAELFDATLYPGTTAHVPLCQEEFAHLAGVSRPTANRVLHRLELAGVVTVTYGAITVHDVQGLRCFGTHAFEQTRQAIGQETLERTSLID